MKEQDTIGKPTKTKSGIQPRYRVLPRNTIPIERDGVRDLRCHGIPLYQWDQSPTLQNEHGSSRQSLVWTLSKTSASGEMICNKLSGINMFRYIANPTFNNHSSSRSASSKRRGYLNCYILNRWFWLTLSQEYRIHPWHQCFSFPDRLFGNGDELSKSLTSSYTYILRTSSLWWFSHQLIHSGLEIQVDCSNIPFPILNTDLKSSKM